MLYKKVLMINLGQMSSLRLGPGSAFGEQLKLKVRFVNQKKKKKNELQRKLSLKRGKGLQGSGLGKGGRGSPPSSPVHCSTRFARLNSFSYFLLFFYFDICDVACGGKKTFSLKTERAVSVFQRLEELSVSICAEATSKFFALNDVVFWSRGFWF